MLQHALVPAPHPPPREPQHGLWGPGTGQGPRGRRAGVHVQTFSCQRGPRQGNGYSVPSLEWGGELENVKWSLGRELLWDVGYTVALASGCVSQRVGSAVLLPPLHDREKPSPGTVQEKRQGLAQGRRLVWGKAESPPKLLRRDSPQLCPSCRASREQGYRPKRGGSGKGH